MQAVNTVQQQLNELKVRAYDLSRQKFNIDQELKKVNDTIAQIERNQKTQQNGESKRAEEMGGLQGGSPNQSEG
jgi:vacuolar-type H+-ATPase subunit I/STV1